MDSPCREREGAEGGGATEDGRFDEDNSADRCRGRGTTPGWGPKIRLRQEHDSGTDRVRNRDISGSQSGGSGPGEEDESRRGGEEYDICVYQTTNVMLVGSSLQ